MSAAFATVEDMIQLWRPMTADEQERAGALLPLISDALREEGYKAGHDADAEAADRESFANVLKIVTVDITSRVMRQSTDGDIMSQVSQSAMGYTWSGTYAIPGGGISNAIMDRDLRRLGWKRQRIRTVEVQYGRDQGHDGYAP